MIFRMLLQKTTSLVCLSCHRQCAIVEHTFLKFYRSKLRFCPFCGESTDEPTGNWLKDAGYVGDADDELERP